MSGPYRGDLRDWWDTEQRAPTHHLCDVDYLSTKLWAFPWKRMAMFNETRLRANLAGLKRGKQDGNQGNQATSD